MIVKTTINILHAVIYVATSCEIRLERVYCMYLPIILGQSQTIYSCQQNIFWLQYINFIAYSDLHFLLNKYPCHATVIILLNVLSFAYMYILQYCKSRIHLGLDDV